MPTTPTYPGVYIEEIPSGVRTITGVATSIAAFIDYFDRGPMDKAVQLFNMGDFQREFGGLDSQSEASYAIQQFFLNGGTEAWVVRVASDDPATAALEEPTKAEVQIDESIPAAAPAALTVTATSPGKWGNHLRVRVDPLGDGKFNLTVSDFEAVDGRNVLVGQEIFRNLSTSSSEKNFVETVVNDPDTGSKHVRVKANGGSTPLANGTLSGQHTADPTIPTSPKLRVTIGGNHAAVPLKFSNVNLPNPVPLTTIAPALQSALRGSLPAEPTFAGATVEVADKRLRILTGSDNPDNRVTFANIASSPLANNLKLTTSASPRRATLSGEHGSAGPIIPAASSVDVKIGTGPTATTGTAALNFSDLPSVTLPGPVRLQDIAPKLEEGIVDRSGPFGGVMVRGLENRLLVLSPAGATNPVEFLNTFANTPSQIRTADALKLTTGTGASTRVATLSDEHDPSTSPRIQQLQVQLRMTIGGANTTVQLDFSDLGVTLPGRVPLEAVASKLQTAIAGTGVAAFNGIEVHAVGNRLLVLSPAGATNRVEFANVGGTQTADDLKLTGAATERRATLSGDHGTITSPTSPVIPAAPPVNVKIGSSSNIATAPLVTAPLVFPDNVTLPTNVPLADVASQLQAAIRRVGNVAAFTSAIVAVARSDRLLVLPGSNADNMVVFTNAGKTQTAEALQLTGAATKLMATLSGDHSPPNDKPQIPAEPEVDVTIGGNTATAALDFSDLPPGVTLPTNISLADIAPRLQEAIRQAGPNNPAFNGATVDVAENRLLVLPGGANPDIQVGFATTAENKTAENLQLTNAATANLQEYKLGGDTIPNAAQLTARLSGVEGTNGVPPDATALIGDEASKTGIYALEDVDLFNLLCIPRVADLPTDQARAVITVAQQYCEKRRAFFLMDTPHGVDEPQEIKNRVANIPRHRNAALFYPRVKIPDPLDDFRLRSVGASGTMAGLFARTDTTRGVWKAPAGTAATLINVSQLDDVLTDQENGALNPLAINCLRNFPIYGNVSWGARTLDGSDQQASEWKYIPVRRLALFLEESLYRGIKWVVFEPNDEPLWSQIRLNVGAFMHNLFRQGAFQGQTPRDAYFVKCDAETTTQNDINLGIVNILVGFAPLKPAEFVILKIQQMAGQIET